MRLAVFLDRDGVLIEDRGLISEADELHLMAGVPEALAALHDAGFLLVVVSNQTVVARGLLSEDRLAALHRELEQRLQRAGAPPLDGLYVCPHHPEATLEPYRVDCPCRKPRPGLLLQAARELDISLADSFLVGDRLSDVIAGHAAGCRSLQVLCGRHADPPIVSSDTIDPEHRPDHVCADLRAAAAWILEQP